MSEIVAPACVFTVVLAHENATERHIQLNKLLSASQTKATLNCVT